MRWRATDSVEPVGALLLRGDDGGTGLAATLLARSRLWGDLPLAHGDGWAVLRAVGGPEPLLPRVPGAVPLYQAVPGWWWPVGWRLDVPATWLPAACAATGVQVPVAPPVVLVPRGPDAADAFPIGTARALADLAPVPA